VIEINLLPSIDSRRPSRRRASATAMPKVPSLRGDPWMVGLSAAGLLVVLGAGWSFWGTAAAKSSLELRIAQEVTDSTRFATTIALVDALRARQDTIQQKISVIRSVDTRRYVWPRLLDQISYSLPAFTWVNRLSSSNNGESGPRLTLEGAAGSTQALTRFMKNLEESPFIRDVTLVTTEQVTTEGRTYNRFTVEAQYAQPDSTFLQTVPVVLVSN
jgi:Tfp pilus assembly protein PilN